MTGDASNPHRWRYVCWHCARTYVPLASMLCEGCADTERDRHATDPCVDDDDTDTSDWETLFPPGLLPARAPKLTAVIEALLAQAEAIEAAVYDLEDRAELKGATPAFLESLQEASVRRTSDSDAVHRRSIRVADKEGE